MRIAAKATEQLILESSLRIREPIFLERCSISNGEIHVHVNFRRGAHFHCQNCGSELTEVHDTVVKIWRHMDFMGRKCYVHMRTPRIDCYSCGISRWTPPWASGRSHFTELFESEVVALSKVMPVNPLGRFVDEHDTRLWRIIRRHAERRGVKHQRELSQ
ncbi:MAG: transposase family protein [Clostridiales bacterium]|jgi:transposase|nr:transposase family protein [Clostridiales bacterium]